MCIQRTSFTINAWQCIKKIMRNFMCSKTLALNWLISVNSIAFSEYFIFSVWKKFVSGETCEINKYDFLTNTPPNFIITSINYGCVWLFTHAFRTFKRSLIRLPCTLVLAAAIRHREKFRISFINIGRK